MEYENKWLIAVVVGVAFAVIVNIAIAGGFL